MVNGKWLMRGRALLTLQEQDLIQQSQEYAKKIDLFLIHREQSVLSKLIAIGGAMEEESFEVQIKVPISDPEAVLEALKSKEFEILRSRHYHEYDTYFLFGGTKEGRLRYREDEFIDEQNRVNGVRSRLTLIGADDEKTYQQEVLLSRSRYLATASHSLRFYREYFKPQHEVEIEKDRRRFLVRYEDLEFFINLDKVLKPDLGYFLEVKSRTWSRKDAEIKSKLAVNLVEKLGAPVGQALNQDYFDVVTRT
jgi:5-methylthioadenosine/S-adenosylhomocysteine deaminase